MKKYTLTASQLRKIANLAVQENGEAAVAEEVSLMANLFELQSKYRDIISYIRNGGWFYRASFYMDNGKASDAAVAKTKEVLVDGRRTLPAYVNEHDCFQDITSAKNSGKAFTKTDRSQYKRGVTRITNRYGSVYTFYCFPSAGSDPFGYTDEAYRKLAGAASTQAAKQAEYGSETGKNVENTSKSAVNTSKTSQDQQKVLSGPDKVIAIALAEEGYLEKKSNSSLNDKSANAGSGNYTKYWRDTSPSFQGEPWCDAFVSWCFKQAYGEKEADRLLCGGLKSYYTPESAQKYKDKGQWHTKTPKAGDQVFFRNDTRICHTGIVYKADSSKVYTIEGNTSAGSQVVPNGGAVCRKSYTLTNSRIAGYGRPDYGTQTAASGGGAAAKAESVAIPSGIKKAAVCTGTVTASSLSVRVWPGTENDTTSFSPLIKGKKVSVCSAMSADDGSLWYYIKYAGKYGFVSAKYVKI